MDINLFDFDLPNTAIALRPHSPRDEAKMLVVQPDTSGMFSHKKMLELSDELSDGDLMIFNDTRVIPARLYGKRGEAKMEITLHKRQSETQWWVFARPAKKARVGDVLSFDGLDAVVEDIGNGGERLVTFQVPDGQMTQALEQSGEMPLPPYIAAQRAVDDQDKSDYQTTFAKKNGAVAAPTAGLHFTDRLLKKLEDKGVRRAAVTLHVGAGTFLPVKVENTEDHKMHSEYGEITQETADLINETKARGGRIVAVGTTSMRLLESAADDQGKIQPFYADTDIFISPGYKFKCVDALITNFHLPKSTLFMLVSAFCGLDVMQKAYHTAISNDYRFYSYGDGSLLFRKSGHGMGEEE